WSRRKFADAISYSEDDEWTRWCRAQGYEIVYVPESLAMHSHNYTPAQAYKRSFGEAQALAYVWTGKRREINWLRTFALGLVNDVNKDFRYCARNGRLSEMPHALRIRWKQRRGRVAGFRRGWRLYRQKTLSTCDSLWMAASRSSATQPRFAIKRSNPSKIALARLMDSCSAEAMAAAKAACCERTRATNLIMI